MWLVVLALLARAELAAASCDASVESGAQEHVVSWSNAQCGLKKYTDVDFVVDASVGTGTGTGTVPVGTCCEPQCEKGYKPVVQVGRTKAEAVCNTGSLPVLCEPIDCNIEGPHPKVAVGEYSGLRGVCAFFSALAVFAIGANNYGNAVAIAIASQATTLRVAASLALVFELLGAAVGNWWGVQNVIFSDLVDLDVFGDNPEVLMQAMVCVSMAVAAVMLGFSALGIPVSVTHITVGGLVGVVNVWQNRVTTARAVLSESATLEAGGLVVPGGGCGIDGTEDCVDWSTVFVRLYIVGFSAPVIAGVLAWSLRKFAVGSGEFRHSRCASLAQSMLALLWGFPLLYLLFVQILERITTVSPPPVVVLKGNQTGNVKWLASGIEIKTMSAFGIGDGNPWLAVLIFVFLLFVSIASTARCIHASWGRGGESRQCCCCNINGLRQILAWVAWASLITGLIIQHLAWQNEWRGTVIRDKYAWVWAITLTCALAVLVMEVLQYCWSSYGAPCIGGRSCCDRQLGEKTSQKQTGADSPIYDATGTRLVFAKRVKPCCPLFVDCCNDERDQHSRAWRCRIGGCCRRVNHAENPNCFLTHAPRAVVDCLCVQEPMEPVRKAGVGQGVAYHADTLDKLDALKNDGNEYFRKEQYDRSIAAYSAAIAIAPENNLAPLYCSRSAAYNKKPHKGDHELALHDAQEAIDLRPKPRLLAKAHLRLGEANEQLGRYKLARAAFERAIELEPENKLYRDALYRVLAEDGQLKANKRSVLDAINNRNSAMDQEGIPEITMTHADFATLEDLTVDVSHDSNFQQTSAKLMISQTPGVQGGSPRRGDQLSPVENRERRRMRAEKLVQHAERGAHNMSEHQYSQRQQHSKEVDLEEQKEFAESNCKEYLEHEVQLARERMADVIAQDWSQRVDVEMQTRILAEEKAEHLQRSLRETQELLQQNNFDHRPVYVISRLQTVARPPKDLPNLTKENLQNDFKKKQRWPEQFQEVQLLRVVRQQEDTRQKNRRLKSSGNDDAKSWPYWVLEFEAKIEPQRSLSVAQICEAAHNELRSSISVDRFSNASALTMSGTLRSEPLDLEKEGNGLMIPEFQREDVYVPVKESVQLETKTVRKRIAPEGKLVFTVRNYYWPWASVPSNAIAGQPQPVAEEALGKEWQDNGWRECYVGPSQPASDAADTTFTHRRSAQMVRETQGGYADLVCISAMATSFLQGASDFLVSMAPLLIMYEVYGGSSDGSEGGLSWTFACPLERIGVSYTDFSMSNRTAWGRQGLTDATGIDATGIGRRSLLATSTCEENEKMCMLQNNFTVSASQLIFGVVCLGLGAIGLGHKTLNRLSFELVTSCAPADGFCATTAATIVWVLFLLAGIPISLTYLTMGAMIGMALGIGVDGPKVGCSLKISKRGAGVGVVAGTTSGLVSGLLLSEASIGVGVGVAVAAATAVGEAVCWDRSGGGGATKWNRFLVQVLLGFVTGGLATGVLASALFSFAIAMLSNAQFQPLLWPTIGAC